MVQKLWDIYQYNMHLILFPIAVSKTMIEISNVFRTGLTYLLIKFLLQTKKPFDKTNWFTKQQICVHHGYS